jgi:hypothetical protein
MGNSCCQGSKDEHGKNFIDGKPGKKVDPALNELLKEAKKNEEKIVKI